MFFRCKKKIENQRPAHQPKAWARWEREEGHELRSRLEYLKAEAKALEAALQLAEKQARERGQNELESLTAGLEQGVENLATPIEEEEHVIRLVLELAEALEGRDLGTALRPIFAIESRCLALLGRREYAVERGAKVRKLDPCPKLPQGLKRAAEQIQGYPIDVPATPRKWREWAARAQARARDEAALKRMKSGQ